MHKNLTSELHQSVCVFFLNPLLISIFPIDSIFHHLLKNDYSKINIPIQGHIYVSHSNDVTPDKFRSVVGASWSLRCKKRADNYAR